VRKKTIPRKLLVATAGLASVVYVACGNSHPPGNLPAPPPTEHPPGNLPAPPPVSQTATVPPPATVEYPPGNLPAPPPIDPASPQEE
jgi:hypothetical protein